MRFALAVLLGRVIRFVGKFIGRSTTLPGRLALRLDPDFLRKMKFDGKVLAVTGSNGKTTTQNLIAHILRENGYSVINNTEGSNLSAGVATTLLEHCTLGGRIKSDFVVLEVDERFTPIVFSQIPLDIFLVNNLLRDQVVRNGNPDIVLEKIAEAVPHAGTLVLNADDPISLQLADGRQPGTAVTFGMARTPHSTDSCQHLTHDAKVCPKCFGKMEYDFFHYNHIGSFHCPKCGYHTPAPDFLAEGVDFESGDFTINGAPAHVDYMTAFYFMNFTAATAVCATAGVPLEAAIRAGESFTVSRVRYDEFDVDGRRAILMLTKQNPVSLDQNIDYVITQPGPKTVALYVNNVLYTEDKDISWLYDVSFERLVGRVDHVVCSGGRAYDLAVRLELAGFDPERLIIEADNAKLREAMRRSTGTIYVLAASAFGDEDGILEVLK